MKVYPIFLNDLAGRRCVVFGGGQEAERKVLELVACDATVCVISDAVTPRLAEAASRGHIAWIRRGYASGDLDGAFLTIVSETDPSATEPIFREAERGKVLINAMDDVPHCSFVAGSVVRRGPLVVAISTSGTAPALSVRLRERLERDLGAEYEAFLMLMAELRAPMSERFPTFQDRRDRWYRIVDSDVLEILREKGVEAARERIAMLTGIELQPEADQ